MDAGDNQPERSEGSETMRRINKYMELSRLIQAPVEQVPLKAVEVVKLVIPHLADNTNPREAALVIAVVYAYLVTILTREEDNPTENAHALLDVAVDLIREIDVDMDQ